MLADVVESEFEGCLVEFEKFSKASRVRESVSRGREERGEGNLLFCLLAVDLFLLPHTDCN